MRTTGTKMAQTATQILADLETVGFGGTLEVTFRSSDIVMINQAPLPAKKMIGGVDAKHRP